MSSGNPTLRCWASKRVEDRPAFNRFVRCHGTQNGIQGSDAKVPVGGHSKTLARGVFGLDHNVAAFLVDDTVAPISAESLDKLLAAQIAWDLHELARTSSRTK
jgi:hypothetical protein